jgi:ligand-binding sensor domain-containing protein
MTGCALALAASALAGPAAPVSFEHLPADAGVSSPVVFTMRTDRTGFLWLGTMYGLVRWDGRECRTFRHDPYDSTSLSHDDVVAIAEDARGDLWIGTWGGGADHYDRAAGRFEPPRGARTHEPLRRVVASRSATTAPSDESTGRGLDR